MLNFKRYIMEAEEADLIGILKSHGAGEIEYGEDHLVVEFRKRQQIADLVGHLPPNTDYDVYVYSITEEGELVLDEDEEGNPELIDNKFLNDAIHTYEMIVYLDNAAITEQNEQGEEVLIERKRIIKINAKGQRRIKIKCRPGFKFSNNKCVKITGSEKVKKKKAIRKAVRTKRAKGSGFQRRVQRLRKRAIKKRRSMGLRTGFEPVGETLTEGTEE